MRIAWPTCATASSPTSSPGGAGVLFASPRCFGSCEERPRFTGHDDPSERVPAPGLRAEPGLGLRPHDLPTLAGDYHLVPVLERCSRKITGRHFGPETTSAALQSAWGKALANDGLLGEEGPPFPFSTRTGAPR
jgi:hypothetical protein